MTLTFDLTPEVEAKINWNAKQQGVSPTDFVRRLVENASLPEVSPSEPLAETEAGVEEPTLWERSKDVLEAIWARQSDGPATYYSEREEACDVLEVK